MTTEQATNGEVAEIFAAVEKKFGFVPNLIREMSLSPAVARVYLGGQEAMAAATLSASDQQVVQLAVAVHNECSYCRAAHRLGGKMAGLTPSDIEAIDKGEPVEDLRVRSLAAATRQILEARGWLDADSLAGLEADGIDRRQVYEIVALIGLKTISNFVNHIAHTKIDEAFSRSQE